MPQRSTPTRRPTGHALFQLRDFYLPRAIQDLEYWIDRYQTHNRYNRNYIEDQMTLNRRQIEQITKKLKYLSAA